MNNIINILVDDKDLGVRIDILIKRKNNLFSRTQFQKLIEERKVKFNDKLVLDRSIKIKEKGRIVIELPKIRKSILEPQKIKLEILYENENYIVLNKPAGMVIHPAAGNFKNTLVNALLYHCKNSLSGIGGVERPGIIHRIDKMTSGIIVVAKNDFTHQNISNQFKLRIVKKKYEAFVWNKLKSENGKINQNICRSSTNRKKMTISKSPKGKCAVTEYKLLDEFKISSNLYISKLSIKILTGRTHQIRVHMESIGNNLVGDQIYKKNNNLRKERFYCPGNILFDLEKIGRQALHAKELNFIDPITEKNMVFRAPMPKDLELLNNFLKNV